MRKIALVQAFNDASIVQYYFHLLMEHQKYNYFKINFYIRFVPLNLLFQ